MELWGLKTIAWFDVWSIEHFFTGVNMYFWSRYAHRRYGNISDIFSIFGWVIALCFAWETLEHYLELGLGGAWLEQWLQGVEYSMNRLVTDPLLILLGALLGYHVEKMNYPAKIFSAVWLLVHLFLFPDSMYLQRLME